MPKLNYIKVATESAQLSCEEQRRLDTWQRHGLSQWAARAYLKLRSDFHGQPGRLTTTSVAAALGCSAATLIDARGALLKHRFLRMDLRGTESHWTLWSVPSAPRRKLGNFRGSNGFSEFDTWTRVELGGGLSVVACSAPDGSQFEGADLSTLPERRAYKAALKRRKEIAAAELECMRTASREATRRAFMETTVRDVDVLNRLASTGATRPAQQVGLDVYARLVQETRSIALDVVSGFKWNDAFWPKRYSSRQIRHALDRLQRCDLVMPIHRYNALVVFPCPGGPKTAEQAVPWSYETTVAHVEDVLEQHSLLPLNAVLIKRYVDLCRVLRIDGRYPYGTWESVSNFLRSDWLRFHREEDENHLAQLKSLLATYLVGIDYEWPEFSCFPPTLEAFLRCVPYVETVATHRRIVFEEDDAWRSGLWEDFLVSGDKGTCDEGVEDDLFYHRLTESDCTSCSWWHRTDEARALRDKWLDAVFGEEATAAA